MNQNLHGGVNRMIGSPMNVEVGNERCHMRAGEGIVSTCGWLNSVWGPASGNIGRATPYISVGAEIDKPFVDECFDGNDVVGFCVEVADNDERPARHSFDFLDAN